MFGAIVPGAIAVLLFGMSFWVALSEGDWAHVPASLPFALLILGPFAIYYFLISSREFLLVIGVSLVCVSAWAVLRAFTDTNSTAGLNVLWIPTIGYPLAAIGALLDRISR